jgi:hypothetical protein
MIEYIDQISPREQLLLRRDDEQLTQARDHEITVKKLELEERRKLKTTELETQVLLKELELKLRVQEAKLRRIPFLILKLPLVLFIGPAIIVTKLRGREVDQNLLDFLR